MYEQITKKNLYQESTILKTIEIIYSKCNTTIIDGVNICAETAAYNVINEKAPALPCSKRLDKFISLYYHRRIPME